MFTKPNNNSDGFQHIYLLKITPNITVGTTSITDYPNVNVSTLNNLVQLLKENLQNVFWHELS